MLTPRQHELLRFIHAYVARNGVSPSFEEMRDSLNLKSKSGIHRLISALEERGYIRRLAHRARAIELLRAPPTGYDLAATDAADAGRDGDASRADGDADNVIRGHFGRLSVAEPAPDRALPLYGRIAAGTPIEAISDPEASIDVPEYVLGEGEHFALEVVGDSMVEAGIHDGDLVLVRRCDAADNNTIVVALVDGGEATLKRLHKRGDKVALEAANAAYETRVYRADQVRVQGQLAGLIRRYR
ncbi:MAG: transcriptional repressor LexA [Alphaproteobacteria bacterium]|nr:transcriptional repressor LexA [Alphaproteobacteria bacterium]